MKNILAQNVLFIKLGESGKFEKDCIEVNNSIRLSYRGVPHNLCLNKDWDAVRNYFIQVEQVQPFVASSHTNQIRQFYEEDENTLWITFYANKLWWCFSKPDIKELIDNTKERPVIGKWSDKDINGNLLLAGNISGKLLKTQGYRGTICSVLEKRYALLKINNEQLKEVMDVEEAMHNLKVKLAFLIQHLQWKDFEGLVDLIFRQAGWQRISERGKTQKSIDLELLAPVTGERAIVQIKSQSNLKEFNAYQEVFANMTGYDKFFYVVHSPQKDLQYFKNETENLLFFSDQIAELTISSGLVEWVIKRTS